MMVESLFGEATVNPDEHVNDDLTNVKKIYPSYSISKDETTII